MLDIENKRNQATISKKTRHTLLEDTNKCQEMLERINVLFFKSFVGEFSLITDF